MDIWHSNSQVPPKALRVAWVAAYTAFIGVNVASQAGFLGATNADVSAKFPVPLTPAGWAFSVWGIIFLLEGFGTVYMLMHTGYDPDGSKQRYANAVGPGWVLSWLAAAAWQFAFVQQTPTGMWLATVLIAVALAAMGRALGQLYAVHARFGSSSSSLAYVAFFLPTSINCAWLSVATAVQALIALSSQMQYLVLQSVLLAAAVTAAGTYILLKHKDTAFGVTLVWALVAVYEKSEVPAVSHTSLAALAALLLGCLVSVLPRRALPADVSADFEERQPLRGEEGV